MDIDRYYNAQMAIQGKRETVAVAYPGLRHKSETERECARDGSSRLLGPKPDVRGCRGGRNERRRDGPLQWKCWAPSHNPASCNLGTEDDAGRFNFAGGYLVLYITSGQIR